jgi:serine/threonine protein kinase
MPRVDLDDYVLGERLGAGTVGTIFLAKKKQTGDTFAVKLLSPAVSSDKLVVSRFAREMLILEKLSHPNILAYHGGGKHDHQLFYVMEFIRGGTLKDMMSSGGPLTWREAAEAARQIAAALQHAHNHGIIHRDLKPGNVFVTESGELKLGDFGIARDTHEQDITDAKQTVGTYRYMAPELVRGERAITGQVDLYALGCVLFEMLAGVPPFDGDNFAQIFDQHLKAEPPSVVDRGVDCPQPLDDLIRQLLSKNPEDRPFNARWVQGFLGDQLNPQAETIRISDADRRASELTLARQMLSNRVSQQHPEGHEATWGKIGWCVAAILAAILVTVLVSQ